MLFSKPKRAVGIDIGTHSVKTVEMSRAGRGLRIEGAGYALVDRNEVNADPVAALARALNDAVQSVRLSNSLIVGALPGQTVVIRYPRLPDMPISQIADAIEREAGQNIPYDLSEVFLDWSLLESVMEGDEKLLKVLLVAAKHEVIESRVQVSQEAEIPYGILTVDSLALADAAECCDYLHEGETVALVNIGLTSVSIHFTKDGVSNFIRDVSWGARELINAVSKANRCDYDEAERILCDPEIMGQEEPDTSLGEPFHEVETESEPAESGGSLLDPFEDELDDLGTSTDGTSLEDTRGDTAPDRAAPAEILRRPLGRLVSEIRRSFEYYEHQLYEGAVDRLILSGGVANLPVLRSTLVEELGFANIDVANPAESALLLGNTSAVDPLVERSAQFMVAVGLAARGVAEL